MLGKVPGARLACAVARRGPTCYAAAMQRSRQRLAALARAEVEAVIRDLPRELRERARAVPVTFEAVPGAEMVADGVDPDLLGLFVGEAFDEEGLTNAPLPAQVILFLHNLWDEAEGDDRRFRDEVRTTYFHELGHYLGLDEIDLGDRGLE